MSAADMIVGGAAGVGPGERPASLSPAGSAPAAGRAWLRFTRSELGLVFRRRRNLALLAVVAAVPVLIGVALRLAGHPRGGGGGGGGAAFFSQVTGKGPLLSLCPLPLLPPLVLPPLHPVAPRDP